MEPTFWTALIFVLACYAILLVVALLVAALIALLRRVTTPRTKPAAVIGAGANERG